MPPGGEPTVVDARQPEQVLGALLRERAGIIPEWVPTAGTPGFALAQIAARFITTIAQRLERAPDKNKLAFFDLLGVRLIPAQAARAPIVFTVAPNTADTRLPANTRIAAPPPPGQSDQVIFETEEATGVAVAQLLSVVSAWPGRDQYIDHSQSALAHLPFHPFHSRELENIPHIICLAHDTLLALAGQTHVEVSFDLTTEGNEPLTTIWEYWDGQVWRQFRDMQAACGESAARLDGTAGFTRSGSIALATDCAKTERTAVNGTTGFWVRGRLNQTLPPAPARILPEVDRIRLTTQIAQPLELTWSSRTERVSEPYNWGAVVQVQDSSGVPLRGVQVDGQLASGFRSGLTDVRGELVFSSVKGGGTFRVSIGEFQGDATLPATVRFRQRVTFTLSISGLKVDQAVAEGTAVDVSKPFFPFGQQPQPGAAFYFSNQEIFSKPGAKVRIYVQTAEAALASEYQPHSAENRAPSGPRRVPHSVNWEYWNGHDWALLPGGAYRSDETDHDVPDDFTGSGILGFDLTIPLDFEPTRVNNQERLWMRVRLASGVYGVQQTINFAEGRSFSFVLPQPPVLSKFLLGYSWQQGPYPPEHVLTTNDFQYVDRTAEATWPGSSFQPFVPPAGTPALYLGFDRPLPVDRIGLLFDILEVPDNEQGPALRWSYWDGVNWQTLPVEDETGYLRRPGIVSLIGPGDSRPLSRFEETRTWLRAELKEDGPPGALTINGVYLNAVWAAQHRTVVNEPLGASSAQPNQVFAFRQIPVLPGQQVEVRELAALRANVEWRTVARELFPGDPKTLSWLEEQVARADGGSPVVRGELRLERDRTKRVTEVWVRWQERRHFFFSGPDDRHYVLERSHGRLYFGDGRLGKVPPLQAEIQASVYRTGGGEAGNLPAGAISQLLAPTGGIGSISNPLPATGGADGETPQQLLDRAPGTVRKRDRALTAADYETLAREASASVASAWVVPATGPDGQPAAGWLTLVVLPRSNNPRPQLAFGLRQEVLNYVTAAGPAGVAADRVYVTGPTYQPVDVRATLVPLDPSTAGEVDQRARQALETFFHPVLGGAGGRGWQPGQSVYLADVATLLEGVAGVDFVEDLSLSLGGGLSGDRLDIDPARVVAAGTIRLGIVEE